MVSGSNWITDVSAVLLSCQELLLTEEEPSLFFKGGIKGGLKRGKDEKQKTFVRRFVVITVPGLCTLL
jgi:hypothetical protein